MNVIPFEQQVAIISALTEGCSIRATERLTGMVIRRQKTAALHARGRYRERRPVHFFRHVRVVESDRQLSGRQAE